MSTEVELKYLITTTDHTTNELVKCITHLLNEKGLIFTHAKKQLENNYFDSDLFELRQMDIGLRIRQQNEHLEQTIKTAGKVLDGLHQRPEYNVNLSDNLLNLSLFPEHIWPAHCDVESLQNRLKIIFSTNFTRYTWLIQSPNGDIELALDKGMIVCNNTHSTADIYEIEIELKTGETQALFDLAKQLKTITTMEPGNLSKAARGYALYQSKSIKQ